jgi:hypothetical protein
MWVWAVPGFALAVIVWWIVSRILAYRRLFADESFLEVAREVDRLKVAALNKITALDEDESSSPTDPRALVTSAGLALFYTVRRIDDRFVHHYSVSVAGRYTAHTVGEGFALFVAKLLGVPFEALTLEIGPSAVHHAEFHLSSAEQSRFALRAVARLSLAEIKSFRKEWLEARKYLQWKRLEEESDLKF